MTETQWRFLKAISDRVEDGRIVEVRLFPAIRQGGAESGVAVVAVEELNARRDEAAFAAIESAREEVAAAEGAADVATGLADATSALDESDELADAARNADGWEKPRLIAADIRQNIDAEFDVVAIVPSADVASNRSDRPVIGDMEVTSFHQATDHEVALSVGHGDSESEAEDVEPALTLDDMLDMAASEAGVAPEAPSVPKRYAVLAARYRLTLKGPDRGHWDFEITHEADAPLDTVDRVARGVARRAGDEGEPESLSAYQLESTLSQPWWNSAT